MFIRLATGAFFASSIKAGKAQSEDNSAQKVEMNSLQLIFGVLNQRSKHSGFYRGHQPVLI